MALTLVAGVLSQWQFNRLADAREALASSVRTLDQALDAMPDGFLLCDKDNRVLRWNERYVELFPWMRSVLRVGMSYDDLSAVVIDTPLLDASRERACPLANSVLARMGHRVHLVADGQQAVEAVRRGDYDAVLMDLQMPGMAGMEATQAIRALDGPQAALLIIAMTVNAFDEDRQACLAAGMDDYVAKPTDVAQLAHAIARCSVAVG